MPAAAGDSAGPREFRYWAVVLSSVPVVIIALFATPIIEIVQQLPVTYTLIVGALALVAPFKQVFLKTIEGSTKIAALTAFVVAALPIQLAGMPMAFWAVVAGIIVTALSSQRVTRFLRPGSDLVSSGSARM
jgi:benzoate membrane transport protein